MIDRNTAAALAAILFIYCLSLYPAILRETTRKGTDAPIYWEAGRGNTEYMATDYNRNVQYKGWMYSDKTLPPIRLLAILPYPYFLLVIHTLNSIGLCALLLAAYRRTGAYPILGLLAAFVVGATASDAIANGNLTGMLVGMSLHPVGALLACAVKPHYALALVFHAAVWANSRRAKTVAISVQG